jgi:hypothetical protein
MIGMIPSNRNMYRKCQTSMQMELWTCYAANNSKAVKYFKHSSTGIRNIGNGTNRFLLHCTVVIK